MNALKAHVENGRIVVDEPTTLPNGTVLHVVAVTESENVEWEIDAGWREEVQRRSARIRTGEAKTTPWEVARSEIFGR